MNVPMAVADFKPDRILLRFSNDISWVVRGLAIFGSFSWVFGAIQGFTHLKIIPAPESILLLLGLILTGLSIWLRGKPYDIVFQREKREAIGLPSRGLSTPFSKIRFILLDKVEHARKFELNLEIDTGVITTVASGISGQKGLILGSHLSQMIARPFKIAKQSDLETRCHVNWVWPSGLQIPRYPLDWLILSAAMAAFIILLLDYGRLSFFDLVFWPRWVMLLAITFPGIFLTSAVYERFGLRWASNVTAVLILFLVGSSSMSIILPSAVQLGFLPGIVLLLTFLTAATTRNAPVWLGVVTILAIILGFWFGISGLLAFQSLRNLDGGVADRIEIWQQEDFKQGVEPSWIIEKPSEIREFVNLLKNAPLLESHESPRTSYLIIHIKRPFARTTTIRLSKEGVGDASQAVAEIEAGILGRTVLWGGLSSHELDLYLSSLNASFGFWPPRYGI